MNPVSFNDSTYEEPPSAVGESMRELLSRMIEKCPGFDGLILDEDDDVPEFPSKRPPPDLILTLDGKEVILHP